MPRENNIGSNIDSKLPPDRQSLDEDRVLQHFGYTFNLPPTEFDIFLGEEAERAEAELDPEIIDTLLHGVSGRSADYFGQKPKPREDIPEYPLTHLHRSSFKNR